MELILVAAVAENRVIGHNNQMPWHLPPDLKHFKQLTSGHHIIMGRKTFESIGRPLPNRVSVIITHKPHYTAQGCVVVHSLDEALQFVNNQIKAFVIGGAAIYEQAIKLADRLEITQIHATFKGDTFFPEIDEKQWEVVDKQHFAANNKNPYPHTFVSYRKK